MSDPALNSAVQSIQKELCNLNKTLGAINLTLNEILKRLPEIPQT